VDLLPAAGLRSAGPVGILLHLALAGNAQRRIGQGVESADGDLAAAAFAHAVGALLQPQQGAIDLAQLARIQFGQLRGHLLAARLEGHVRRIARRIRPLEVAQAVQLVGQFLVDVRPPAQEGFMQSQ
jgi:hypothetical protein